MKRAVLAITFILLGLASGASAQTAEQLVGAWKLVSAVNISPDGKKTDSFGSNPTGVVTFTADGHYTLLILRSDLPKIASKNRLTATADENKAIVLGSVAHFGTYAVHDKSLTIKLESGTFPNANGTEQTRALSDFNGESWKWTLTEPLSGVQSENEWKRM